MNRTALSALALAGLLTLPAAAAPEFAPVLQDHMVLQRDEPVVLWGKAKNGETVTVEWKGNKATARAAGGQWQVELPASAADAEGSTITATDSTGSSTLNDVLVGDVWLASGQSNMEWNIRQTQPIPATVNVNNAQVRLLRGFGLLHGVPGAYSDELYKKAEACNGYEWNWRVCSAATIRDFSAVATYFATRLQENIKVPVGIICNAKGGSSMEAWIPREVTGKKKLYATMRGDKWIDSKDFDAWSRGRAKQNLKLMLERGEKNLRHPFAPSYQYDAAIKPLEKLNIKGVIWYQGESNADNPDIALNTAKQKDIIQSWRHTFRKAELPFLMVQLPRINAAKQRPHWAEFREVQARVARELPQVGLICTIDLGSTDSNVHPTLKYPVGHRLADLARNMVYGENGLPGYPAVKEWKAEGNSLRLRFDRALRTTDGAAPRGFVVGTPGKAESFTEVETALEGDTVTLTLPRPWKKKGMAWRYINTTYAEPNLVAEEGGLPAFPARSDISKPGKSKGE